ncbi:MAG: hypothetical protein QM740_18105 [Acidovorax sp.]
MQAIKQIWEGKVGLARTYWGWGVLGILLWSVALSVVVPRSESGILLVIAWTAYFFVVNTGIWRAAGQYAGPKGWAILARIAAVMGYVLLVGMLLVILLPVFYLPKGVRSAQAPEQPSIHTVASANPAT